MARKKVVMILLEGCTDEEALGTFFVDYFTNDKVITNVLFTDITSENSSKPTTIKAKVGNSIKEKLKQSKLNIRDVIEVIHIVDMDGAYIDDAYIYIDPEQTTFRYDETGIYCKDKTKVSNRNHRKRQNIETLGRNTSGICNGISYHIYYMSCNLEHVLHGIIAAPKNMKSELAARFANEYGDNLEKFLGFIKNSNFSVNDSYEKSWEFITEGLHSLERHTNLGLCFPENRE